MSDLSFENNDIRPVGNNANRNMGFGEEKVPLFQRLIIKTGIAQNRQKADKILIITAIVLALMACLIFVLNVRTPTIKTLKVKVKPAVQRIQVENRAQLENQAEVNPGSEAPQQ